MEAHWLFGKENVSGAAFIKKFMLKVFLDWEGPIIIDFLKKKVGL